MSNTKKLNIVFDASQYDLFRLCEQRFNYRYNLNKTLPTKAEALDKGTIIHLGCETYFESLKSGAKYDYAVNASLMKMKASSAVDTELEPEIVNHLIDTMEEYFDYWRVVDQNIEIVGVEEPFLYLLHEDDNVRIHMAGKIDLLYNDEKDKNMPMDHKSYQRSFETGRMSNQFKNYCRATNSNFLIVDKIGLQKTLKPHEKFIRVKLCYDPLILDEWKDNVVKVMYQYINCMAEGVWPTNETSCDKYNRRCEYYDVCDSSGKEAKEFKLANLYVDTDPWDVTKVMKKTSEELEELKSLKLEDQKKEEVSDGEAHTPTKETQV